MQKYDEVVQGEVFLLEENVHHSGGQTHIHFISVCVEPFHPADLLFFQFDGQEHVFEQVLLLLEGDGADVFELVLQF